MKNIRNLFLVLLLAFMVPFSSEVLAKGKSNNASISNASDKVIKQSNKKYDEVCDRIYQNFRDDSQFANNFAQVRLIYVRTRYIQSRLVYRDISNIIPDYNYNYPTLLSQYIVDLNNQEIEKYKNAVKKYCVYGKYYQKDPNACSTERINSLF